MNKPTDNLEDIAERLRERLSQKDAVREKVLPLCRDVIRYCSQAIRSLHRHQFEDADSLLEKARQLLAETELAAKDFDELLNTGYYRDAQKEFAEASITLAMVGGKSLPEPEELGVDAASYLNGMSESVGEMRRFLLDGIRRGDFSRVESIMESMDEIYSVLVTMDFPDAITHGLRRNTDIVRGILEKTRGDITLTMRQKNLEEKLNSFKDKF